MKIHNPYETFVIKGYYEKIIADIIKALETDGEDANDGECLDWVAQILRDAGYKVFDKRGN